MICYAVQFGDSMILIFYGNISPSQTLKMKTLNETSRSRQKSELGLFFSPKDNIFLQNVGPSQTTC
jgi:hypothetical protein